MLIGTVSLWLFENFEFPDLGMSKEMSGTHERSRMVYDRAKF